MDEPPPLRLARVLAATEERCEVAADGVVSAAEFAAPFPRPRAERVAPGHLVALVTGPDGGSRIVWRWYDAVMLGPGRGGEVRLWEPGHGEVAATARPGCPPCEPGCRVWASAGLPGAAWWVADLACGPPAGSRVELDEVAALYSALDLWPAVLGPPTTDPGDHHG